MSTQALWDHDEPIRQLGLDVPDWIDPDISGGTIAAVIQGGCSSGAYMPAVTYHEAAETMAKHGDDVLDYLEESLGEIPDVPKDTSWSGMACFFLSCAVELWCSTVEDEAERLVAGGEDES